jgi:hypothetical protein
MIDLPGKFYSGNICNQVWVEDMAQENDDIASHYTDGQETCKNE